MKVKRGSRNADSFGELVVLLEPIESPRRRMRLRSAPEVELPFEPFRLHFDAAGREISGAVVAAAAAADTAVAERRRRIMLRMSMMMVRRKRKRMRGIVIRVGGGGGFEFLLSEEFVGRDVEVGVRRSAGVGGLEMRRRMRMEGARSRECGEGGGGNIDAVMRILLLLLL